MKREETERLQEERVGYGLGDGHSTGPTDTGHPGPGQCRRVQGKEEHRLRPTSSPPTVTSLGLFG